MPAAPTKVDAARVTVRQAIAEARELAEVARRRYNVPGGTHNVTPQDTALADAVERLAAVVEFLTTSPDMVKSPHAAVVVPYSRHLSK